MNCGQIFSPSVYLYHVYVLIDDVEKEKRWGDLGGSKSNTQSSDVRVGGKKETSNPFDLI